MKGREKYVLVILAITLLVQMSTSIGITVIPPLSPFIQEELKLTRAQIGMIGSAISFGQMFTLIISGWLVDIVGIRIMLFFGQLILGIFLISTYLSSSFLPLVLIFLFAGIGKGVANPASTKAVASWFEPKFRGTAMGIKQAGVPIGGMLTAGFLPILALNLGWHLSLLVIGSIIIVIALISLAFYRDPPSNSHRFISNIPIRKSFSMILGNSNLIFVGIMGLSFVIVQWSFLTYSVLYLTENHSLSVLTAGQYLAMVQASGVVGRVFWGVMSDKILKDSRKSILIIIGVISLSMSITLSFISKETSHFLLSIILILMGFSAVGWNGLFFTYIVELSGLELAGIAIGFCLTILQIGAILGPPFFGYLVDLTNNYSIAFHMLSAFALVGIASLTLIRNERRERRA